VKVPESAGEVAYGRRPADRDDGGRDARDDARDAAEAVKDGARQAADSEQMTWVARLGMGAHGAVYVLLGVVALLVSAGSETRNVDQRGALSELASHTGGWIVLVALAAGFAAYAVWMLSRVVFGDGPRGKGKVLRVESAFGFVAYALLTASTVSVLLGSRQSQEQSQQGISATVMSFPGGRILVGLAGLCIVGVAGYMLFQGLRTPFMKNFRPLPAALEVVIRELGRVGSIGRAIVFGVVGVLVVSAAVSYEPQKAGGIDDAFRTALSQPYGRPMALAAAAALVAFGLYGLAEAAFRRV
jgi:hypothetical protein